MLIKSFQKVILKSSSVNVFSDIFCKNMVHLLSTLKRISICNRMGPRAIKD